MISINVRTMGDTAKFLKEFFERHEISCWICVQMDGGIDFRDAIVDAVKKCHIFLPLINSEWASSGECKDEFNFAKRLNLTSHESGRSLEGENRLPVILPIAFPNLVWNQYPHVELLASSTNFIVHKQSSIITFDAAGINTINSLIRSINALKLKGIPILPFIHLDDTGNIIEVGGSSNGSGSSGGIAGIPILVEDNVVADSIRDITTQMVTLIKQMQTLQSTVSSPQYTNSQTSNGSNSTTGSNTNDGHNGKVASSPLFPLAGWQNSHLRDRYLGMAIEYSWTGVRNTWSVDIVIETRTEGGGQTDQQQQQQQHQPLTVTGHMRWRLINAVPHRNDYDKSRMAAAVQKIADAWEADEVFTGSLDVNSGHYRPLRIHYELYLGIIVPMPRYLLVHVPILLHYVTMGKK